MKDLVFIFYLQKDEEPSIYRINAKSREEACIVFTNYEKDKSLADFDIDNSIFFNEEKIEDNLSMLYWEDGWWFNVYLLEEVPIIE